MPYLHEVGKWMQKKKISRTLCKTGLNKSSECLNWLQIMTYTEDGNFFYFTSNDGSLQPPKQKPKNKEQFIYLLEVYFWPLWTCSSEIQYYELEFWVYNLMLIGIKMIKSFKQYEIYNIFTLWFHFLLNDIWLENKIVPFF